jgi:hypothetical protein
MTHHREKKASILLRGRFISAGCQLYGSLFVGAGALRLRAARRKFWFFWPIFV